MRGMNQELAETDPLDVGFTGMGWQAGQGFREPERGGPEVLRNQVLDSFGRLTTGLGDPSTELMGRPALHQVHAHP